jgi:hypothetical protein
VVGRDPVGYRRATMTLGLWLGIAIFVVGLGLRLWARRPFVDAYVRQHATRPPSSWLWTASPEPDIERWRRRTLLGTALLWVGAIVGVLNRTM